MPNRATSGVDSGYGFDRVGIFDVLHSCLNRFGITEAGGRDSSAARTGGKSLVALCYCSPKIQMS